MIYIRYFVFSIIFSMASIAFCVEGPYDRFAPSTQFAELAYKNPPVGPVTGFPHVTFEDIQILSTFGHGEEGKVVADYLSAERSGFRAHIMEHRGETIVAIRGTKDPLHMILDLHIMYATAGTNPKETLDKLLQEAFGLGVASRALVSMGVSALTPDTATPLPALGVGGGSSFMGAIWDAAKAAACAAAVAALPAEIEALYSLVMNKDSARLQALLQERFHEAVRHAKVCIQTAIGLHPGQRLRVVGHSLGGALATVAMAELHGEGSLSSVNFEVNAICSPGSLGLLGDRVVDEVFLSRVFNLVRAGDIVSNFGTHIGQVVPLASISEATRAVLRGETGVTSTSGGLLSYFNPMAYGRSMTDSLMYFKDNHSSVGALLDVRALAAAS